MGKISPVSGKYVITATIDIDGVVEKPDVIGAVFGQTEGLLGSDLELRELQRSGRIGRIEVDSKVVKGKVSGIITIPSSLDKAETAIVAAAMEVIERIGPCEAKIRIKGIEDVRISKRDHVIDRAKELLKGMVDEVIPDSTEIAENVGSSVKIQGVETFGKDKLPCGPDVKDSEEVIVVEGRADVVTLLRYGFKNAIAMNGASVPKTIIDLTKEKTVIVFVDGDRGGVLNTKELISVADIDFVATAPDGKEVEELTQKEIHKALRSKVTAEVALKEAKSTKKRPTSKRDPKKRDDRRGKGPRKPREDRPKREPRKKTLSDQEKESYAGSIKNLSGSKEACLMDETTNVLGKVPIKELEATLKSLKGSVHAVAVDGKVDQKLADACDDAKVKVVVGKDVKEGVKSRATLVGKKELAA